MDQRDFDPRDDDRWLELFLLLLALPRSLLLELEPDDDLRSCACDRPLLELLLRDEVLGM